MELRREREGPGAAAVCDGGFGGAGFAEAEAACGGGFGGAGLAEAESAEEVGAGAGAY